MFGPGFREEIKFFQESGIFRFVRKHFKIKLILVEVGSQIVNPGLNLQLVYWLPQKNCYFHIFHEIDGARTFGANTFHMKGSTGETKANKLSPQFHNFKFTNPYFLYNEA